MLRQYNYGESKSLFQSRWILQSRSSLPQTESSCFAFASQIVARTYDYYHEMTTTIRFAKTVA